MRPAIQPGKQPRARCNATLNLNRNLNLDYRLPVPLAFCLTRLPSPSRANSPHRPSRAKASLCSTTTGAGTLTRNGKDVFHSRRLTPSYCT